MTKDLFDAIGAHLAHELERGRARTRFQSAMRHAEWEHELWAAIRPFLHSPAEHRAAAAFMAAMLRERARD